jgi:hypothetical protein
LDFLRFLKITANGARHDCDKMNDDLIVPLRAPFSTSDAF